MRWNRERELRVSRVTHGLLGVLGLVALAVFIRELPALRRYLRMERM
jgi:hypothetical protein